MENSGGGGGGSDGVGLGELPENCISTILSFTSVEDVCNLAAVCPSWRSAANADMVWERMITQHYGQNLSEAMSSATFPSKKELYFCLTRDHGSKSIWLDRSTGKIGCMISARDLSIAWGENNSYWEWVIREDSRFEQVAKLRYVWWFDVRQCLKCDILSPNTRYTVSFVVRMDYKREEDGPSRNGTPFIFSVTAPNGSRMESARFLHDLERSVETHRPGLSTTPLTHGEDGWMEFVAGEFFLEEGGGSDEEIEFSI